MTFPAGFDWPQLYTEIVATLPGGLLVEIGTYLGRSLCHLGQLAKDSGKPFTVIGVDWCRGSGEENGFDHHSVAVNMGGGTFAGQLHRNVIDCGLADTVNLLVMDSKKAAGLFADGSVAFVFIDAQHDYEAVKADIERWKPKIMVGGYLGGDDIGIPGEETPVWPGVLKAVVETLPGFEYRPHDSYLWCRKS